MGVDACVFLHVAGGPAAGFALAARIEGSHGAEFYLGGDQSRVVLTHEARGTNLPHEAIHRHCLFAKVLTSFARPQHADGPDHIVKFACLSWALDEKRLAPLDPPFTTGDLAPEFPVVGEVALPRTREIVSWLHRFPAEHAPPDFVLGLKSTVLLI